MNKAYTIIFNPIYRVKINPTRWDPRVRALGEPITNDVKKISKKITQTIQTFKDGTKIIEIDRYIPSKIDNVVNTVIKPSGDITVHSRNEDKNKTITTVKTIFIRPNGEKLKRTTIFINGELVELSKYIQNQKGDFKRILTTKLGGIEKTFTEKFNKFKEIKKVIDNATCEISRFKLDKTTNDWIKL